MDEDRQVLVTFTTKLPAELTVSAAPLAVPTTLKRYGLSQIINHLLGLDPARPFDFVIHGELVRKSLEAHLTEHQLSAESVLEVEYVPAVVPPKHKQSAPHDDWVSAVAGGWGGQQAASGSYDGCVRLWDLSGQAGSEAGCSTSWKAHAGGVSSVACSRAGGGARLLVTAGKDRAVLLWQVAPEGAGPSPAPQLVASFSGHMDSVEAVALSPNGTRLASCGWDGGLRIWRMGQAVVDDAVEAAASAPPPAKSRKRKTANGDSQPPLAPEGGLREEAAAQLQGHIHCVSSAAFATDCVLFSGGWDHSVRRWDVATGINTDTYNGSKAVYAVACPDQHAAQPATPGSLVAFGSSDRAVRVWDARAPRSAGEVLSLKAFSAHKGWVVGAAWRPGHGFHIATASHDSAVKVWDVRTSVPLASLEGHSDKALCVGWAGADTLMSGGADCKMLSFSMGEQGLNSS